MKAFPGNSLKDYTLAWILSIGTGIVTGCLLLVPVPLDILEIPLGDIISVPTLIICLALKYSGRYTPWTSKFVARFVVVHVIISFFLLAFNVVQLAFTGLLVGDIYFEGKYHLETHGDVPQEARAIQPQKTGNQPPRKSHNILIARQQTLRADLKELNEYVAILLAQEKQGGGKND